ncbi:MAG: sigma-70 family RNA polymerase sigma factor [Acidobacteriota bacterium]|nr:sigma-70 family RNA polymerase sigma factor [Acidobacteriota bacterium]
MPRDQSADGWNLTQEDFQRIHRKIFATLKGLRASDEEAEELAQEAFLQAFRSRATFRGQSQLDTWIVGVAKKVWLQARRDATRKKRARQEVPLEPDRVEAEASTWAGGSGTPSPQAVFEQRRRLERVKRAFLALPRELQRPLKLFLEGKTYAEIAEALKVKTSQVSSLIHRARQKLRRAVEDRPADSAP